MYERIMGLVIGLSEVGLSFATGGETPSSIKASDKPSAARRRSVRAARISCASQAAGKPLNA